MRRHQAPALAAEPATVAVLPVRGVCLVCSRVTPLIAEWRGPGEGVCWSCWAKRWEVYP